MNRPEPRLTEIVDRKRVLDDIYALHDAHGDGAEFRARLVARLKQAIAEGRARLEAMLMADGGGTRCARRIAALQDVVIEVLFDIAVNRLYRATVPSTAERVAVMAVGGYGRGTMAPGSDVDLLFVIPYKKAPWAESVVEHILYALWDLGLKVGHATRTVDECLRLARDDMTIRTAVLDARFIVGDEALAEEMMRRFRDEVVAGTTAEFVEAKLAERDDRHRRAGESRYLVEPNIKDGKGGQRDLHTLYWLAKYHYGASTYGALAEAGVFTRAEAATFRRCEDFLWAVRCHLHFMTGRAEERLGFDVQREMAARLGYTAHPGQRDVERFMKHVFLVAKDVGDLTRILCSALEVAHAKKTPPLSRFMQRFRRKRPGLVPGYDGFVVESGRLGVADDLVFDRDPVALVRMFHVADRLNLPFHPDALRLARRKLSLIDQTVREDGEANRLFLEILTEANDPEVVLRRMNEAGVLGRFVPDFGRVVAMMQFSLYHHYTVDEHLLRAIGILADIERGRRGAAHPLATEIIGSIENRRVLYVALFLHDIAKGRPEDHSLAGAKVARRLCPRFGLTPAETRQVVWLVENHLHMSMVAQSRDLADPKTIADFAGLVQSLERLKLLLVLTAADIDAVGPGVWNGWKAQLLATLYNETEPVLAGGHSRADRPARVEAAKAALRRALSDWSDAAFAAYAARHYPAYWLRTAPERQVEHARFLAQAERERRQIATRVSTDSVPGGTEITVLAPDHPRLLSVIAGACAAAGGDIVDAQIFTTCDGFALDTIMLRREFEAAGDERRRGARVGTLIEKGLRGELRAIDLVARRASPRARIKAFDVAPDVTIGNTWSDRFTVIEVSGLDRPGLLHDLTLVLARLNLNIASAHVATFGERAVDVFYVTDLIGHKITNANRQAAIRRNLVQVFATDDNGR